jgi:hypothetical protein
MNTVQGGHTRAEVTFAAVADQVYYLVVDNTSTDAPGDGALTLTLNGAARLDRLAQRPDGNIEVTVFGERYRYYALETSTNLTHWTAVSTNIYYNALVFEHNAALSSGVRFYRARLVDP